MPDNSTTNIIPELKIQCADCHQPIEIVSYKDGLLTVKPCAQCLQESYDAWFETVN